MGDGAVIMKHVFLFVSCFHMLRYICIDYCKWNTSGLKYHILNKELQVRCHLR